MHDCPTRFPLLPSQFRIWEWFAGCSPFDLPLCPFPNRQSPIYNRTSANGHRPDRPRHSEPTPTKNSSCHSEPAKAGEEPAVLSSAQLQSISTYIDILVRWN